MGGQVGEVEITEGVFGVAVGVVVGVGRRLEVVGAGRAVWGRRLVEGAGGAVGGVGDVGVDGGGVVGEQFDAVGEQPGVFVGADVRRWSSDVAQVFGGGGEQSAGWPVRRR